MTTELPTEQKIQQIYEKVSKARSSGSIRELVYMQIDGKIYELVRAMSWGGLQGHQWPYARKRISDMLLKFTGAEFDIETVRDVLESFQNPKTNSPFDKAVLDMAYNVLLDTLEIQTTEHTTLGLRDEITTLLAFNLSGLSLHKNKHNYLPHDDEPLSTILEREMNLIHKALLVDFSENGRFTNWKKIATSMFEDAKMRDAPVNSLFENEINRIIAFVDQHESKKFKPLTRLEMRQLNKASPAWAEEYYFQSTQHKDGSPER